MKKGETIPNQKEEKYYEYVAALYWLSMLGASLLPGTRWVDPEFEKETRAILAMPPQLFLLCGLLAVLIVGEILPFL